MSGNFNESGRPPSVFAHVRDIILLPVTMTMVVPYLISGQNERLRPDYPLTVIFGILILLTGLTLFGVTVWLFGKVGHGTLAPWNAPQKLVIRGPYRHCRNPMISAILFILIGESILFNSMNIMIWAIIFFTINTAYFLLKEEPDLQKRFGTAYSEYKKHVSRWIPKMKSYNPDK